MPIEDPRGHKLRFSTSRIMFSTQSITYRGSSSTLDLVRGPLLRMALPVAGVLHIFANVLKDVDRVLPSWPKFLTMLKQLEKLISFSPRMERFVALCIQGNAESVSVGRCRKKYRVMYDKRWGEVHNYCRKVLDVFWIIKTYWSEEKYCRAGIGEQETDDDGYKFDPKAITTVIHDSWFISFLYMVLYLGELIESLVHWSERCPCHEDIQRKYPGKVPIRVLRAMCGCDLASSMTSLSCPFRGCRAPDMAVGELFVQLDSAYHDALGQLTLKCRERVSGPEWVSILQEFDAGRAYVHFILTVKLQNWQQAPWIVCALAHQDESKGIYVCFLLLLLFSPASPIRVRV